MRSSAVTPFMTARLGATTANNNATASRKHALIKTTASVTANKDMKLLKQVHGLRSEHIREVARTGCQGTARTAAIYRTQA